MRKEIPDAFGCADQAIEEPTRGAISAGVSGLHDDLAGYPSAWKCLATATSAAASRAVLFLTLETKTNSCDV